MPSAEHRTLPTWVTAVAVGLAAGLAGGLFGVGGGLIIVPGLVLLLGKPQHLAHATSLAAIIFLATAGMVRFGMGNSVDWTSAVLIIGGAIVGAVAGARLAGRVPEQGLAWAFIIVTFVAATRLLLVG